MFTPITQSTTLSLCPRTPSEFPDLSMHTTAEVLLDSDDFVAGLFASSPRSSVPTKEEPKEDPKEECAPSPLRLTDFDFAFPSIDASIDADPIQAPLALVEPTGESIWEPLMSTGEPLMGPLVEPPTGTIDLDYFMEIEAAYDAGPGSPIFTPLARSFTPGNESPVSAMAPEAETTTPSAAPSADTDDDADVPMVPCVWNRVMESMEHSIERLDRSLAAEESLVVSTSSVPVCKDPAGLLSLLTAFLESPLSPARSTGFESMRAWLQALTPDDCPEMLGRLVLALATRMRRRHYHLYRKGGLSLNVPMAIRMIGMSVFKQDVRAQTPEQVTVLQSSERFYKHLCELVNHTVECLTGKDPEPSIGSPEYELETTFEDSLRVGQSIFTMWLPTFAEDVVSEYTGRLEGMLSSINRLYDVQPRMLSRAMDDLDELVLSARDVVSGPVLLSLVNNAVVCRAQPQFGPVAIDVSRRVDARMDTLARLFAGDRVLEMMYEVALDSNWHFDRIDAPYHVYMPSACNGVPDAYQSLQFTPVSKETWDKLSPLLQDTPMVGEVWTGLLRCIMERVVYFLTFVLRADERASSRRLLAGVLSPTHLCRRLHECSKGILDDCAVIWEECEYLFKLHLSEDSFTSLGDQCKLASACSPLDRAYVAQFVVYFFSCLDYTVSHANRRILDKYFEAVRVAGEGREERLASVRALVVRKCTKALLPAYEAPWAPYDVIADNFFRQTITHFKREITAMGIRQVQAIAVGNMDATRGLFARVLVSALDPVHGSHLSETFPEIYRLDDTRLLHASKAFRYLVRVAAIVMTQYRHLEAVPSVVRELCLTAPTVAAFCANFVGGGGEDGEGDGLWTSSAYTTACSRIANVVNLYIMSDPMVVTPKGYPGHAAVNLSAALVLWPRILKCAAFLQEINSSTFAVYGPLLASTAQAVANAEVVRKKMRRPLPMPSAPKAHTRVPKRPRE